MKRTSTLCCTLLLSVLCGAQERIPTLDSLNITEQTAPSDWDSYIASWDYVVLEHPGKVEAVESCFFSDHSIIIQGVADGTPSLMHYKLDGTYVGTVGKFGMREGSYAHASSILLDEANDRVSV